MEPLSAPIKGRYRVIGQIAEGGMGVLLRGYDSQLDRHVAIKILNDEFARADGEVQRFLREARALAKIEHPNVIRVYDSGIIDDGGATGRPFIVMELLRGHDLKRHADIRGGKLPCEQIVPLMLEACSGLGAMHDKSLVHRDIKPENLFVADSADPSSSCVLKVLEFGLAKERSSATVRLNQTQQGVILGTPPYMSPEQVQDAASVDARSDIWSLGVVMYQLVSGQPPFGDDTLVHVLGRIVSDSFRPAPLVDTSPLFASIVSRCLARRPADRFQSTVELRGALVCCLDAARPSIELAPKSTTRPPMPRTDIPPPPRGLIAGLLAVLATGGAVIWARGVERRAPIATSPDTSAASLLVSPVSAKSVSADAAPTNDAAQDAMDGPAEATMKKPASAQAHPATRPPQIDSRDRWYVLVSPEILQACDLSDRERRTQGRKLLMPSSSVFPRGPYAATR